MNRLRRVIVVTMLLSTCCLAATGPVFNRKPLETAPFAHLPLGAVRAQGWLAAQLKLQKAGLTGSAEKLYEALTPDSGWLGGKGENWEKGPYYVRGLIALAYTLDDAELKDRAAKWIDWALQSQKPDGSFGPAANDDWWPRMVVLWYLRDYYEATGDARVVPFFSRYFAYQLKQLPTRPLKDWGRSRAGDNIDIVLWTYNLTGETSLLDLARLLHDQAEPWTSIFTDNRFYAWPDNFQPHHIVNVNQAMKFSPVAWQFTHDLADKNALAAGMANLMRQYGRIDGQISGTEQLSGLKSTDGVELCADIERIISDGVAVNILGDPAIADQMEKVAYNSLPAHTSPRMQQMTYYQLLNQVAAQQGGHGFHEDYSNGNVPGPYSGFPCCCYNWHTGWPKFVQNMWAATSDGGLALIAYGPNRVTTTVAGDVPITITQATEYPFDGNVTLDIEPQRPTKFPLVLRVPGWCSGAQIFVDDQPQPNVKPGEFHRIEREWKPGDTVRIQLPMSVRASTWTQNSLGVERGPLAFGLAIKEQWKLFKNYPGGFNEYQVVPVSPWNYALQIDRQAPSANVTITPVSKVPWDTAAPPVTLSLSARRVPGWTTRTMPGQLVLGKANHSYQQLADASAELDPAEPHHLRIEVSGKKIRVFIDGAAAARIDRDDDAFAAGAIGFRTYDTAATFADVKLDGHPIATDNLADGWRVVSGKWLVQNGAIVGAAAKDGKLVLNNHADLHDFVLEATLTVTAGGNAGLIFRTSDVTPDLDGYSGYYVGLSTRSTKSGDAQEPPMSPVTSNEPLETVELIPFGSSKLRVSYFPVLGSP